MDLPCSCHTDPPLLPKCFADSLQDACAALGRDAQSRAERHGGAEHASADMGGGSGRCLCVCFWCSVCALSVLFALSVLIALSVLFAYFLLLFFVCVCGCLCAWSGPKWQLEGQLPVLRVQNALSPYTHLPCGMSPTLR